MQSVIARHDSSLVTFSSADAISTDPVYGAGRFTCNLNNANRGATHAIKILPSKVLVPNVLQNVKAGKNTVTSIQWTGTKNIVIPEGINSAQIVIDFTTTDTRTGQIVVDAPGPNYVILTPSPIVFEAGEYTPSEYAAQFNASLANNTFVIPDDYNFPFRNFVQLMSMSESDGRLTLEAVLPDTIQDSERIEPTYNEMYLATPTGISFQFGQGDIKVGELGLQTIPQTGRVAGNYFIINKTITVNPTLIAEYATPYTIPPGFYSTEGLLGVINAQFNQLFTFAFENERVSASVGEILTPLGVNGIVEHAIVMGGAMAQMLGIHNNTHTVVESGKRFLIGSSENQEVTRVTANTFPHMGTSPVVHILAKEGAMNNMVASNSQEYNVIATVPMNDAVYGAYASYTAPDTFVDDIDFRSARSMQRVDFEVLDHNYNTVVIDPRFPVIVQLKVYHTDTRKG